MTNKRSARRPRGAALMGRGGDPGGAIVREPRMSFDSSPITPRFQRRHSTDLGANRMMTGGEPDDPVAIERGGGADRWPGPSASRERSPRSRRRPDRLMTPSWD